MLTTSSSNLAKCHLYVVWLSVHKVYYTLPHHYCLFSLLYTGEGSLEGQSASAEERGTIQADW